MGPADWSGTAPTGRSRHSRVLPAADYCSRDANDACLVRGAWLQSRRLVGDHCSHTVSHLVNGARAPRKERAACWKPASLRSDWSGFRRLPGSRCLVGPAACRPYRQAVVGAGLRLTGVTSRVEWQQRRAVRRSPHVQGTLAAPHPGRGGDGLHCSHTRSCLLNGGTDFEGAMGRLLGVGLSGGRLPRGRPVAEPSS